MSGAGENRDCRISFIPGETEAGIKALIRNRIAAVAESDPWQRENPPTVEWFGWHTDPWLQDPDHPFIQTFRQVLGDTLGQEVPFAGAAAGLDTRFAGRFGIPAFGWGPRGGNMHGIDEYVEISSVVETARALALLIARWSGLRA